MEFRCILFLDTSESGVFVESRCIWNIWFLEHTSGLHDLGPVRCIIALVSVGDTSGLKFQCPSRCTRVQIYLKYTSGWANIDYFRCIAKYRHPKIHRSSGFSSNPDVSQLISRDATYIPFAAYSRASQPHFNFPRLYFHPLEVYSRASQPHFNFPRIYSHPLEAYSRANQPHITQRELYIMYSSRCRTPNKTITQNIIFL